MKKSSLFSLLWRLLCSSLSWLLIKVWLAPSRLCPLFPCQQKGCLKKILIFDNDSAPFHYTPDRHVLVATLSQQQFFMATMNCCNNFIATIATITTILKIHFLGFRWEVLWFSEQTFHFGAKNYSLTCNVWLLIWRNKWKSDLEKQNSR